MLDINLAISAFSEALVKIEREESHKPSPQKRNTQEMVEELLELVRSQQRRPLDSVEFVERQTVILEELVSRVQKLTVLLNDFVGGSLETQRVSDRLTLRQRIASVRPSESASMYGLTQPGSSSVFETPVPSLYDSEQTKPDEKAFVTPFLFDLRLSEIQGPLTQFQAVVNRFPSIEPQPRS